MGNVWRMATAAVLLAVFSGCERAGGADGRSGRGAAGDDEPPAEAGPPPGELPPGVTAAQGAEGRTLYRAACVMCHGDEGDGTQLGPSLVDAEWSRGSGTFEEIVAVVTEGAPGTEQFGVPMPPRGNGAFSDEQIRAVSAYAFSLARRSGTAAP